MGKKHSQSGGGPASKKRKAVTVLEPGWSGVFVSCPRGKENACRAEIIDLAEEYISKLWPAAEATDPGDFDATAGDVEDQISKEIAELRSGPKLSPVQAHMIGIECVVFLRTKAPVEPVRLVVALCSGALRGDVNSRYVQRLSPVSRLVHATLDNVEKLRPIIEDAFKGEGQKFAIRPTIRNNTQIKRDDLITSTARLVGPGNSVDLKNYEKLILVDVFKSVIGLSVVDDQFEDLSRFNLSQIRERLAIESAKSSTEPISAV